jgi:hypothetical protein
MTYPVRHEQPLGRPNFPLPTVAGVSPAAAQARLRQEQEHQAQNLPFAQRVGAMLVARASGQDTPRRAAVSPGNPHENVNMRGVYFSEGHDSGGYKSEAYHSVGEAMRAKQVENHAGTPVASVFGEAGIKQTTEFIDYMNKVLPEAGENIPVKEKPSILARAVRRKQPTIKGHMIGYEQTEPGEQALPVYLCADNSLRVYNPGEERKDNLAAPLKLDNRGINRQPYIGRFVQPEGAEQPAFELQPLQQRLEEIAIGAHLAQRPLEDQQPA